jgi:hypothetical protein
LAFIEKTKEGAVNIGPNIGAAGAVVSLISLCIQIGEALKNKKKAQLLVEAKKLIHYVVSWKEFHSFLHPAISEFYTFQRIIQQTKLPDYAQSQNRTMIDLQDRLVSEINGHLNKKHSERVELKNPNVSGNEEYDLLLFDFSHSVTTLIEKLEYVKSLLCIDFENLYTVSSVAEPSLLSKEITLKNGQVRDSIEFIQYVDSRIIPSLNTSLQYTDTSIHKSLPLLRCLLDIVQ